MPKLHQVNCVAIESSQAADPAAWDQALEIICRLLIDEYFARRSKSAHANVGTSLTTPAVHPGFPTLVSQVAKKDVSADSEDSTGCA